MAYVTIRKEDTGLVTDRAAVPMTPGDTVEIKNASSAEVSLFGWGESASPVTPETGARAVALAAGASMTFTFRNVQPGTYALAVVAAGEPLPKITTHQREKAMLLHFCHAGNGFGFEPVVTGTKQGGGASPAEAP